MDCPGDFRPRGQYISTHISTLALPVDCSGDFRPRGLRSERRFRRTDLANDTCLWEPKLLLRVGNRAAGACVASSPDSDLEAFSHNPAHGSFAPLAFQPSAMTNCANQRFLSY
ncbi:unnamed protein product [Brassica oleracea]